MTRHQWVAQAIELVTRELLAARPERSQLSGPPVDPVRVTEVPTGRRDAGATVRLRAEGIGTWDVDWRSTSLDELRAAVRGANNSRAKKSLLFA